jgi:hypothetical protein
MYRQCTGHVRSRGRAESAISNVAPSVDITDSLVGGDVV